MYVSHTYTCRYFGTECPIGERCQCRAEDDPLAPAVGVVLGLGFTVAFWVVGVILLFTL